MDRTSPKSTLSTLSTPRRIGRIRRLIGPAAIAATALLLSGCPETPTPKAPPKVPEPKAQTSSLQTGMLTARFTPTINGVTAA